MKRLFLIFSVFAAVSASAQVVEDFKPASTNQEGKEYPIASVAKMPIEIDEEDYETGETEPHLYAMHKSGLEEDDWACDVLVNAPLEDGVYDTSITVESVSPMSFILK